MLEWLAAIAALLGFFLVLPRMLGRIKAGRPAAGGSGVWVGIGLAIAMVFDPKTSQSIELVDQKRDESEDEESGGRP